MHRAFNKIIAYLQNQQQNHEKYHQQIRDNEMVSTILSLGAICLAIIIWIIAAYLKA